MEGSNFKALNAKFKIPTPKPLIKQRRGGSDDEGNDIYLSYVEWYNYADMLDDICESHWHPEVLSMVATNKDICVALRLHVDGIYVDNVGSESINHFDPVASAYAQAFKRCCSMLGFTRDLYASGDDTNGKWKTVERTRKQNILKITELLKKKSVPTQEKNVIEGMLSKNTMHFNASEKIVIHLEELKDKPKRKKSTKAVADKSAQTEESKPAAKSKEE